MDDTVGTVERVRRIVVDVAGVVVIPESGADFE
jgi:hypothetical protein